MDLSAWRIALSGAEPVRADTVAAFQEAFAPYGFPAGAIYPSFGLAEATLFVTGGQRADGAVSRRFSTEALKRQRAELAGDVEVDASVDAPSDADAKGDGAQWLVSCGAVARDHEVRIVDPATGAALDEAQVGEIRVRGPSVAQGYWDGRRSAPRPSSSKAPSAGFAPATWVSCATASST